MFHVERGNRQIKLPQYRRCFGAGHEDLRTTGMQSLQHPALMVAIEFRG